MAHKVEKRMVGKTHKREITVLSKYGLEVRLDPSQVNDADPGSGTPAMVYDKSGACATFWCAMNEGELTNDDTERIHTLNEKQGQWLWDICGEVDIVLYGGKNG